MTLFYGETFNLSNETMGYYLILPTKVDRFRPDLVEMIKLCGGTIDNKKGKITLYNCVE